VEAGQQTGVPEELRLLVRSVSRWAEVVERGQRVTELSAAQAAEHSGVRADHPVVTVEAAAARLTDQVLTVADQAVARAVIVWAPYMVEAEAAHLLAALIVKVRVHAEGVTVYILDRRHQRRLQIPGQVVALLEMLPVHQARADRES
jgi:hypothetical protein